MWKRLSDLPMNIVNHQTVVIDNIIYVIGGYKNSRLLNYEKITVFIIYRNDMRSQLSNSLTFAWNCQNDNFIELLPGCVEPIDCFGHTVVKWRHIGVLFGGCHSLSQFGFSSTKIYLFVPNFQCLPIPLRSLGDTSSKNFWIMVNEIGGNIPVERDGHSAVVWNDYMYLFGGLLGGETRYFDNKMYQMDFKSWQWTIIYQGDYLEPLGRDFCTLVTYKNSLYMFGGRSDSAIHEVTYNDIYDTAVWEFHLGSTMNDNRWKKIQPGCGIICDSVWVKSEIDSLNRNEYLKSFTKCPLPRRSHMAVIFGNAIVVFGGLYETNSFSIHFNDLWSFNIETKQWTQLTFQSESALKVTKPPNLRRGSLTMLNDNCAVLIGGVTTSLNIPDFPEEHVHGQSLVVSSELMLQNIQEINDVKDANCVEKIPIILYHKPNMSFSGSITMINDLSLRSISHLYILLPQFSLYQRSLYVVVNTYSFKQLNQFHIPWQIMSDIENLFNY